MRIARHCTGVFDQRVEVLLPRLECSALPCALGAVLDEPGLEADEGAVITVHATMATAKLVAEHRGFVRGPRLS